MFTFKNLREILKTKKKIEKTSGNPVNIENLYQIQ